MEPTFFRPPPLLASKCSLDGTYVCLFFQAIETLLISDNLFRCRDVAQRKKFVKLVDDVREFGGDVKIFSSMHVSGEQLDQLTGVCAILRWEKTLINIIAISKIVTSYVRHGHPIGRFHKSHFVENLSICQFLHTSSFWLLFSSRSGAPFR